MARSTTSGFSVSARPSRSSQSAPPRSPGLGGLARRRLGPGALRGGRGGAGDAEQEEEERANRRARRKRTPSGRRRCLTLFFRYDPFTQAAERALEELYNLGRSDEDRPHLKPIRKASSPSLATALSAQLQQEAERPRLAARSRRASKPPATGLLEISARPGEARDRRTSPTLELDLRTGDDFQPHDYLHLCRTRCARSRASGDPSADRTVHPPRSGLSRGWGHPRQDPCDPACGSGIFLVEAVRAHLRALRRSEIPLEEWYPRVRARFVGVDIDPIACLYARLNLSLLLAPASSIG